jgi:hypothetical protein
MIKADNLCDSHKKIRPFRVELILYRFRLKIRCVIDCLIFSIVHTEIARTIRATNHINPLQKLGRLILDLTKTTSISQSHKLAHTIVSLIFRVRLIRLVLTKSKIKTTNCIGSLYKLVETITQTNCINSHDKLVLVILEIRRLYFCCDLIQLTKTSRLLISVTGHQKLARVIRPLNFIRNWLQLIRTRTLSILCRSYHKLTLTI